LVKEMDHTVTYPETLEIMEKYQDFSRLSLIKDDEELTPKLNLKIPSFLEKLIWPDVPNIVNQFLHKRGFDPETICRGKTLYYGGHVGKFKFRLILPVTLRGRLISWIGRDLTGKSSISYLNLEEEKSALPIKNTLYGFDEAPPGGNIVVVEGPMDQWKLGPGAVATYGTAWTQPQVTLLRKLNPNSIFILFDSEATAQKSAKKLSEQIWWCNCEVVMLNNANDPGELTVEQGKELMTSLQ
jgi:DNA primase